MQPAISVITPAKNEESNIRQCLEGVLSQSLPPADCIVVNNNSTDKTADIANSLNARVIDVKHANIGELRNIGARAATGSIFAFIDADCRPAKDWLEKAVSALASETVGAVGNSVLPVSTNWVEKTWFFNLDSSPGPARYIGSANLIVKKKIFDMVGGFNPDLRTGEDRELCWRIQAEGYSTIHDKSIIVYHNDYPKSVKQFFNREFWHGQSIISDIQNLNKSRIVFVLMINLSLFLFFLLSMFFGNRNYLLLASLSIILLPFLIALKKCINKLDFKPLIKLSYLYFIYLFARSLALIICATKLFIRLTRAGRLFTSVKR
jgi:glycosyltransferase involved in cell wall biosynthesis